jgi:hypothetical protein
VEGYGIGYGIKMGGACPGVGTGPFCYSLNARKINSREAARKQANLSIYKHLQGLFFIDFFCNYVNIGSE